MPKKILLFTIGSFLLFIFSYIFHKSVVINHDASKFASKFEAYIHNQEREIDSVLKNKTFFSDVLFKQSSVNYDHLTKLEQLSKKPYHISLFQGNNNILWSNNKVALPNKYIENTPTIVTLSNGIYQTISQDISVEGMGQVKAIALLPIRYNYEVKNKKHNNDFAIDSPFPSNIELSETPTSYEIKSLNGKHLCYFTSNGDIINPDYIFVSFLFFLLALLLNVYTVNLITVFLNQNSFKRASVYLIASIFIIIFIFKFFNFESKFSSIYIFQSISINPNLYISYVAIILYLLLGIWMLLFVMKNYKTNYQIEKRYIFFANGVLLSVGIVMTVFLTMHGFKSLIINTNQEFNFSEPLHFVIENPMGLITIVLMTIVQFILSIVLMNMIKKFEQKEGVRIIIYIISLASVLVLNQVTGLNIAKLLLIPYIIILLVVLDIFIIGNNRLKGIWLIGLPALTTFMLVKFHSTKIHELKKEYAELLADQSDKIAEKELYNLKEKIKNNTIFNKNSVENKVELKEEMQNIFSESAYLSNYYNFELFVFDDSGQSLTNSKSPQQTLIEVFAAAQITEFLDVKLFTDNYKKKSSYVLRLIAGNSKDKEVFLQLYKNSNPISKVYSEFLSQTEYKGIKNANKYPFAIYNSKGLVYKSNNSFSQNYSFSKIPQKGAFEEQ